MKEPYVKRIFIILAIPYSKTIKDTNFQRPRHGSTVQKRLSSMIMINDFTLDGAQTSGLSLSLVLISTTLRIDNERILGLPVSGNRFEGH